MGARKQKGAAARSGKSWKGDNINRQDKVQII
jgi:hypothetical protein